MNKFLIKLGIGNRYGSDFFVYESNKTLDDIINAYMNSCDLTKVCFDNTQGYKYIQLACEYQDNSISKEAEINLLKYGLDVWDGYDMNVYDKENDLSFFDGVDHFMEVFWKFVKISLPDLLLEEGLFKKSEMMTMKNFPFNMGYGLFSY